MFGSLFRKRHNDYDYDCIMWYGDRSPARNRAGPWKWSEFKPVETRHRWFGGDTMRHDERRCIVCNPYTEPEANDLLGWI